MASHSCGLRGPSLGIPRIAARPNSVGTRNSQKQWCFTALFSETITGWAPGVTVGLSVNCRAFLTCACFDDKMRESTLDFRHYIHEAAAPYSWCYYRGLSRLLGRVLTGTSPRLTRSRSSPVLSWPTASINKK